jgi:hypothetical protein
MTVWLNHQCAAKGCVNTRDHGRFVGRFCGACDAALTSGKAEHGTSIVFTQLARIRELEALLLEFNDANLPGPSNDWDARFDAVIAGLRPAKPPYPWCRQPSVCRGTCPMDPSCGE